MWRDLDWLNDDDKQVLNVEAHENLAAALLGVFDSQIAGGKRYDLATMGRRRAHATYHASHGTDDSTGPHVRHGPDSAHQQPLPRPEDYVDSFIERFAKEVATRIAKFLQREKIDATAIHRWSPCSGGGNGHARVRTQARVRQGRADLQHVLDRPRRARQGHGLALQGVPRGATPRSTSRSCSPREGRRTTARS